MANPSLKTFIDIAVVLTVGGIIFYEFEEDTTLLLIVLAGLIYLAYGRKYINV